MSCYRLIEAEKATPRRLPSVPACWVWHARGYYAWTSRPPSRAGHWLTRRSTDQIREIHARSRGTYGAPRVHAELRLGLDVRVGRKRVARLMRAARHRGRPPPPAARADPPRPDRDTGARIWSSATSSTSTGPACGSPTSPSSAPVRAGSTSRSSWTPSPAGSSAGRWPTTCAPSWSSTPWTWPSPNASPRPGLVHHTDHGCQYTSLAFGRRLQRHRPGRLDGHRRRRTRQRRRRELLRHPRVRAARPPRLADPPGACGPPCSTSSRSSTTANAATRPWTTHPRRPTSTSTHHQHLPHSQRVHETGATPARHRAGHNNGRPVSVVSYEDL